MNLVIIGSGGHAGVVIQAARESGHNIVGLLDETRPMYRMRYGEILLPEGWKPPEGMHIAHFIAIGDMEVRERLSKQPILFTNIQHPSAYIRDNEVGLGNFFAAGSVIGHRSKIGNFCIVNTNASLDHDSELGDYSHLAPCSVTGGHVTIGHHTTIGIGAMIRDRVVVGNNCVIGMGSVVTRDVPDNVMGYGNPFEIHADLPLQH